MGNRKVCFNEEVEITEKRRKKYKFGNLYLKSLKNELNENDYGCIFDDSTNNFHLYRAMQIAKRQGLVQAVGIAAPSSGKYLANNMLREFFGWLKMVLLD